jgi:hypothetical protein
MRDRRKIDERPNHEVSVNDVLEIIAGQAAQTSDAQDHLSTEGPTHA